MNAETGRRLLVGLRALADGRDDAPHAESAREFVGADVSEEDVRVVASRCARRLSDRLGIDLKALEAQRAEIRDRMGLSRTSSGPYWGDGVTAARNDRVFPTDWTPEAARAFLEKRAARGDGHASAALRSIRRGRLE